MEETLTPVLRETYLSRKPPRKSAAVVTMSLFLMLIVSVAYWESDGARPFFLAATPETVFARGEYWRLFTTVAVHSDPEHYFANALTFAIFSFLLHGYFGAVIFPLVALLGAAATNLLVLPTYGPGTQLVGASGMVYWMAGYWLVMYFCIDRRFSVGARLLRCLGYAAVMLIPATVRPNVSYRAHLVGFVLGFTVAFFDFAIRRGKLRAAEVFELE